MDIVDRLALIIDAHTDGAVSSIKKLSLEETAAAERTDVLKAKIADLETRMSRSATGGTALQQRQLAKLNGEYQTLTATLGSVPRSASRVESALSNIGLGGVLPAGTIGSATKVLPGLVAGAAAFGGFEFIKSGVEDYVNLADAIRKFQYASGASAQDASKLIGISNALGVSTDSLSLGMFRLAKNVALAPSKLTDYGISIAKTSNGNTDLVRTLENVAQAYQNTADPTQRAALVYEAFGRAGTSLLPILNANRKQIEGLIKAEEERGHIFTQADVNAAYQYQIATRELKDAFQGLALSAGKDVVPALSDIVVGLTKIVDKANEASQGKGLLGKFYQTFIQPFNPFHTLHILAGSGTSAAAAAAQNAPDPKEVQALAQQALGTLAAGYDTLAGPTTLRQAKQNLTDAQRSLLDARKERAKALRDLADAKAGTPSASALQIEAATARVTAAEQRLQTAQYVGGPGVATAQATLLSAQATLNRLRGEGAVNTGRLADAEERLRRANERVAEQQRKAKSAQHEVNQATGLTAEQVLIRLKEQTGNQIGLANANTKLATAGLSAEVIAGLDKLNQQLPGTLAKVARGINTEIVAQLNTTQSGLDIAQQQYADAASNPQAFESAGKKAATSFTKGFADQLSHSPAPSPFATPGGIANSVLGSEYGISPGSYTAPRQTRGVDGYMQPAITVQGDLIVTGKSARQVAREVARDNKLRALGSGYAGA